MQHGGDAAEHHGNAAGTETVGNGPATFHLCGEHHRDVNNFHIFVEIDLFHVFVGEFYIDIFGQSGGKNHRAVGRQSEGGLPRKLVPARVYKSGFDSVHQLKTYIFTCYYKSAKIRKKVGFYEFRIFRGSEFTRKEHEWP